MLPWICPECGGEYSPVEPSCPVCAPAASLPSTSAKFARALEILSEEALPPSHPNLPVGRAIRPATPPVLAHPAPFGDARERLISPQLIAPTVHVRPGEASSASQWKLPKWVISTVVTGIVALAIASTLHKLASDPPRAHAQQTPEADRAREQPRPPTLPALSVPTPAAAEPMHPDAAFVEVTDLRLVDLADRTQVQYQVVNHASKPLSDMGLRIAVRTAGLASRPLFTLTARVPKLAPLSSKEIRTDLDSRLPLPGPGVHLVTELKVQLEQ